MKKHSNEMNLTAVLRISPNDILVVFLSCLVALLIAADGMRVYLVPATAAFGIIILLLIVLNWHKRPSLRKGVAFCVLLVVYSIAANYFNSIYLGDFFVKAIILLVSLTTLSNVEISRKASNIVSSVMLILIVVFFIKSFGYYDAFLEINPLSASYNPVNPNSAALAVLVAFLIADRGTFMKSSTLFRLAIIFISAFAIFQYGARAALVCFFLYLAASHLTIKIVPSRRRKLFILVIAMGLLFPLVYVSNFRELTQQDSSVQVLGKDVYSGRQYLWEEAIYNQNAMSLLIGSPNTHYIESLPAKSMHNMYLDIQFQLGLPFLLFFLFIVYLFVMKNQELTPKTVATILVLFLYGYSESTFVSGTYHGMLMMLSIINYNPNLQHHSIDNTNSDKIQGLQLS